MNILLVKKIQEIVIIIDYSSFIISHM